MPNSYVNKVNLADGTTIMDISDTTATPEDVASGKYFYTAAGARVQGSASGGGELFYVTPEDYGAVGDGVTDDSQAVQDACDAGYAVYFASGKTYYLASTVTIDHDCHLFGGEGATIKTKTPTGGTVNDAIVVSGTLKKTTTLTSDYNAVGTATANAGNRFQFSDMTDIDIGDLFVVTATDQFYSYNRQYYYLGGTFVVAEKDENYLYVSDALPWDIENTNDVSVTVYDAPSVVVENLKFESDLDSSWTYHYCLGLLRCKNSTVKNVSMSYMDNGLLLRECVNTSVNCVSVSTTPVQMSSGTEHDHYGIALYACNNTVIERVSSEGANSCVDLSGHTPNMNTYIRNCQLFGSNRTSGLGMHENAYNTIVEDSVIGGMVGYGTVIVKRCRFVQRNKQPDSNTAITYRGSHNAQWSKLTMEDCVFEGSNLQFLLHRHSPQSPIQPYHNVIGEIIIRNCNGGRFMCTLETDETILSNKIQRIVLDNWRDCYDVQRNSYFSVDDMIVRNCTFTKVYWMNDGNNSHGVVLDGIRRLDYSSVNPIMHKVYANGTGVYGDNPVLPEGVAINLSSDNSVLPSADYPQPPKA